MRSILSFLRTTIIGGLVFLLPLVLVGWLLGKAFGIARKLTAGIDRLVPADFAGREIIAIAVAILAMLLVAFLAGLAARTRWGQAVVGWFENSLVGSLPQFSVARGLIGSIEADSAHQVGVVLVPTDAGWQLAFEFEKASGDWLTLFIPGAPEWRSGTVVFAERRNVRPLAISFTQAIALMRKLGAGSDELIRQLAAAKS